MDPIKLYNQLTLNERFFIEKMLNEKWSLRKIAKSLKRSISTISREVKRNINKNKQYSYEKAQEKFKRRQRHKYYFRWENYKEFNKLFLELYDKRVHGVEATQYKIKKDYPNIKVPSVKQIYNWINSNKWIVKKRDRLRRYYKRGGKRTMGVFSQIKPKYRVPIWTRPYKINNRTEFGHWEVDLIIGKRASKHSNLLVLTERKTRFNVVTKIKNKNMYYVAGTLRNIVKRYNLTMLSITSDNGWEFKALGLFGSWLKIKAYYCEPYASYQRGSNENANGLIRRYYKKGTDFNSISQTHVENVMDLINNMPRKMFRWESAFEKYLIELKKL